AFGGGHGDVVPADGRPITSLRAAPAAFRGLNKKRPRVQLFLPIADIPVNVFLILAMGAAVGFVSGMFGIGGGFLMTPLLIFVGISPAGPAAPGSSPLSASPCVRRRSS